MKTLVSEDWHFTSYHLFHLKLIHWEKSPVLLAYLNLKYILKILLETRSRQMLQ